jgi:hypothetical protein
MILLDIFYQQGIFTFGGPLHQFLTCVLGPEMSSTSIHCASAAAATTHCASGKTSFFFFEVSVFKILKYIPNVDAGWAGFPQSVFVSIPRS